MKKIEKILALLTPLGLVMKFLFIPGYSLLLIFPLMFLELIYFIFGFVLFNNISLTGIFKKASYVDITPLKMLGSIVLGWSLSLVISGIIFKIQSYNGGALQLISGLTTTLIILIVALIKRPKTKSQFYNAVFSRIIIIGGLGLILLFTPSILFHKINYHDDPEYLEQLNSQN